MNNPKLKIQKYPSYKDSGIDWLGEMPEHWNVKRLKDLSFLQSGNNIVSEQIEPTGDYPVYGGNGLRGYFSKYTNEGEFILIGRQGALCGNINYASGKFWASEHAVVVYLKRTVKMKWFGEMLRVMNLNQYSVSAAQPGLAVDRIKRLLLPLPPLPEQAAIADYLDKQTSHIDRKIELLSKKAESYKSLKQSLINETVTRGLNKSVAMKDSGIDWLGEVAEHWEVKRIKDFTLIKRGASPRPIDDPKYFDDNGEYSWVRIADLSASERYLLNTKEKLSKLGASLSVKRYPGDFILSIAGTVGKPIITKIKCCIHDGFVWFPNIKINPEFLYYCFSTGLPYQGLGKLGTQLNLNTETVGLISLAIPPKKEIDEIVFYLDKKTAQIDKIIETIHLQMEKLKELRKTLINDVVTGKVRVAGNG